ncbi:MAG: nitroreductase family protein [Chloroflexi bacterium]|nr:nitroreductase family protein [Chloroflexota bacterium]
MNTTIQTLLNRKSIREYEPRPLEPEVKRDILAATLRAPTAGNLMLYSIIDITDQAIKDALAESCDHQPFIATAPMLWLFVADYQRWWDYFRASDTDKICRQRGITPRQLQEGDLLLAACDTVIAAQTAVVAAESLGVGSCYIGDILEKYEFHCELFNLPDYALPIALICFGYATPEQQARVQTSRFDPRFVVFENCYQRLSAADFDEMYRHQQAQWMSRKNKPADIENFGQAVYFRKFAADYSIEMSRSVRAMLSAWLGNPPRPIGDLTPTINAITPPQS